MIDVAAATVAFVAGLTATLAWRLINAGWFSKIDSCASRLERLEDLNEIARLRAAKAAKVKLQPAAGPFRTAPVGDPNTESPLPEPTSAERIVTILPWNAELQCPVCGARNMHTHKKGVSIGRNTETHTACNGCEAHPAPHLHVTCWDCGFKFAVKGKHEAEEES